MGSVEGWTVLFDLDGVLLDSAPVHRRVWDRWSARHALDADRIFAATHGRRPRETMTDVAPGLDLEIELAWLDEALHAERETFELVPGAAEAIAVAQAMHRWGVVTSSTAEHARYCLQRVGVPVPSVLVAAEDVHRGKPAPDPYLRASVLAEADPTACVVVEDAPSGIESARAAGMTVIGVATTHEPEALAAADWVVTSMADAARHLSSLAERTGAGQ